MSRRRNTRTGRFRQIADDIESQWPEHATFLRSLGLGRSSEREQDGFTRWTKQKAHFVLDYRKRKANEDEGELLLSLARQANVTYNRMCELVTLVNDDDVRRFLRMHPTGTILCQRRSKNSST